MLFRGQRQSDTQGFADGIVIAECAVKYANGKAPKKRRHLVRKVVGDDVQRVIKRFLSICERVVQAQKAEFDKRFFVKSERTRCAVKRKHSIAGAKNDVVVRT